MPIRRGELAYIAKEKISYTPAARAHIFKGNLDRKIPFLWGDAVYVIATNRSLTEISAKGYKFSIPTKHLTDTPIFCMWQIDCGQGDAALMRFPNGKTMLIDGGPGPLMSNSPALAPAFVKWMRFVDQSWRSEYDFMGKNFHIDGLVVTHPDYDHYGGLDDLTHYIENGTFSIGQIYHGGLGRYTVDATALVNGKGLSQLGVVEGGDEPEIYVTTLLDDFEDVRKYSRVTNNRSWKLHNSKGTYGGWLRDIAKLEGQGVEGMQRVHASMGDLPGFDAGGCAVKVLGPAEETWKNKPALRYIDKTTKSAMSSPSLTRNGISVVLRFDVGDVRILMTGDLNFRSQALLLDKIPVTEFKCHVAKACHHGSEDVSTTFLRAMSPLATLFSSGDNETHAHPRAKVLGMAGAFTTHVTNSKKNSFLGLEEPKYEAPLIYSTEISRSVELLKPDKYIKGGKEYAGGLLSSRKSGNRKGPVKGLKKWYLADNLIYGLINVRTDGRKVVIGVLKEGKNAGFQTESFKV